MSLEIAPALPRTGALEIVNNNVALAMGAGLIPLPLVDFAAITVVQIKMGKELAEHYGVDYKDEQIKVIVIALLAGYTSASSASVLAASAARAVPGLGSVFSVITLPVIAGGLTFAVGKVFVEHLESNRSFLTFDLSAVQAGFVREVEKGKAAAAALVKSFGGRMVAASDGLGIRLDAAVDSLLKR